MPIEIWWVVRLAAAIFIAWKAVLMLDVRNPLMGIFFAFLFCIAAPFGMELLIERYGDSGDAAQFWEVLRSVRLGAPMAFALIGVLFWAGIESATGQ
jgi:hypothetical protein